ncbi:hypothetical protein HF888_03245 [Bermanella marisrubri]|uniref:Lipoprotein n=1 Tax=Bermanella marisrubri TaxID=207949 RepID=Q1N060_9GAMM|nr:hypothetical protein [Bermanella marisrubri]EAT11657.1 hypothetical protein RED65_08209 [Oceanobacter sp. RED65] [Bermanella marisrubri]QIZ83304.1 hypothetical protein HF888_03245 [Bermanella marisrubri]
MSWKGIFVFGAFVFLAACSNRAVYDGIKVGQENECRRLPEPQREECLDNINTSYDEYQRQRQEVIEN